MFFFVLVCKAWMVLVPLLLIVVVSYIRVSTGEFWNGIMHELMGLGHTWAFLYFFTYLILAQMIMLNLVVAVLLINYGA